MGTGPYIGPLYRPYIEVSSPLASLFPNDYSRSMAELRTGWRLDGGYSRLLDGTVVEAILEEGPLRQELEISPLLWKKDRPVDLRFEVRTQLRGTGPLGLRWSLTPHSSIRARVLFERNAYLGNFRVPQSHFAIQWDIDVTTENSLRDLRSLANIAARTRVHFAWVEVFSEEISGMEALHRSWAGFRIPWRDQETLKLTESQVHVWSWTGRLRLGLGIQWGLTPGWSFRTSGEWIGARGSLQLPSALVADFKFSREGRFHLRWVRRQGKLQLNLDESRRRSLRGGFKAEVSLKPSSGLTSHPLLRPGLQGVNSSIRRALQLQAELSLAVQSEKWRYRRRILRAEWDGQTAGTLPELSEILSGELPASREGFQISGRLEFFQGRRFEIVLHVMDWLRAGYRSEESFRETLRISPVGDLVLEREHIRQKRRYWWDRVQLYRLVHRKDWTSGQQTGTIEWSFSHEASFSHRELKELLLSAARLGAIEQFGLPPASRFPIDIQVIWVTRFDTRGIQAIRRASPEQRWNLLVRSLELSDPERYAEQTFWRDWVESEEVRRKIDENPVHAHLTTQYPLSGRTDFQRRQVVTEYLKAKRFLKVLKLWQRGKADEESEPLFRDLDFPSFVFCHLACPKDQRHSAVILQGGWEDVLGQPEVVQST